MWVVEIGVGFGYVSVICVLKVGVENVVSFEVNFRMVLVVCKILDLNGFYVMFVEYVVIVGFVYEGDYVSFVVGKYFWGLLLVLIVGL